MRTNIPLEAMDAFVIEKVREVLLGDKEGVKQAIDAFVAQVMAGQEQRDDGGVQRDLDAINRRIKITIGMLADPTFDGMDELKTTLAELNARREALLTRMNAAMVSIPQFKEGDLREWANERIGRIHKLLPGGDASVEARNLIQTCVDRIDIYPYEKRGVLYLPADAYDCFMRETTGRVAQGDFRGAAKFKGEA